MKNRVEILREEKVKPFKIDFDNFLFGMEISYFLTTLGQGEENDISRFFDTIILLEEISNRMTANSSIDATQL